MNLEKEKITYVVYAAGLGFGKGKHDYNMEFVQDWTKARSFTYAYHARSLIATLSNKYKISKENILCIPVSTKLDPEQLFVAVLTGK